MAEREFSIDESDFDDAIMEIANEIAQIKASETVAPLKSEPHIALRAEMELEKAKASSINIFKVLKTVQEVQIHSVSTPFANQNASSTIERKYFHHSKGIDKKYHPLTITENVVVNETDLDYHNITIEDLFEDPEPEEKSAVVVSQKKNSLDSDLGIPDSNKQPLLQSTDKIAEPIAIKTVNIPTIITNNINQRLKENERALFKNFLKMQNK